MQTKPIWRTHMSDFTCSYISIQFNVRICLAVIWPLFLTCFHKLSCSLGHNCCSGKLHGSLDTVTLPTHFRIGIKSMHRMPLFQNSKFSEKTPSALLDEDVNFFHFICFHQDRILSWGEHWNSKWRKTSTCNLFFKYKTTLTQKAPITNEPNTSTPPNPKPKQA